MAAPYAYAFLTLERGRAGHQALTDRLTGLPATGAQVIGQFVPQLGWASNEAAVLFRLASDAEAPPLTGAPILAHNLRGLTPTARPADGDALKPGGIHVHRWFTVASADLPEFVALSTQAWTDFEARFDANIFGLFQAEPTAAEAAASTTSLLLITRYGDHGVWEASRDPTTEAMQLFARRQALTLHTRAASTLLVAG